MVQVEVHLNLQRLHLTQVSLRHTVLLQLIPRLGQQVEERADLRHTQQQLLGKPASVLVEAQFSKQLLLGLHLGLRALPQADRHHTRPQLRGRQVKLQVNRLANRLQRHTRLHGLRVIVLHY